jgi:DNA-binding transcriptional regulator YiaG
MKTRKVKAKRLGQRIGDSLEELRDALRSGRPLRERFTVRTIEIAEPAAYGSKQVRRIRDRLAVSQGVFANLLGVSAELVQHWEQGIVSPRPLARRLLDEINRDPAGFLVRNVSPGRRVSRRAAG